MELSVSLITIAVGGLLFVLYLLMSSKTTTRQPLVNVAKSVDTIRDDEEVQTKHGEEKENVEEQLNGVTILFGSQSGNAQHFAEELGKEVSLICIFFFFCWLAVWMGSVLLGQSV